jgi:hypothetical protein
VPAWAVAPLVGVLVGGGFVGPAAARARAASNPAIYAAGLLTRADVPAGWKRSKQADAGAGEYRGIAGCTQLVSTIEALRRAAPHKLSPQFTDTRSPHELASAADAVYAFKTSAAAAMLLNRFRMGAVTTCLINAAKKGGGKGAQVAVTAITNRSGTGDDVVAYQVSLQAHDVSGAPVTAVLDVDVVRVGRALVGFNLTNQDTELSQAPAIVDTVVSRLRAVGA